MYFVLVSFTRWILSTKFNIRLYHANINSNYFVSMKTERERILHPIYNIRDHLTVVLLSCVSHLNRTIGLCVYDNVVMTATTKCTHNQLRAKEKVSMLNRQYTRTLNEQNTQPINGTNIAIEYVPYCTMSVLITKIFCLMKWTKGNENTKKKQQHTYTSIFYVNLAQRISLLFGILWPCVRVCVYLFDLFLWLFSRSLLVFFIIFDLALFLCDVF